jgi:hypothetical protein
MYYIKNRNVYAVAIRTPMEILQTTRLQCPYCWEQIELIVDCSVTHQEYVEDCSVCCSPIIVTVISPGDDEIHVEARSENG